MAERPLNSSEPVAKKPLSQFAVSAAVSGVMTKTACAPFDRIRLLYQVQGMFHPSPAVTSSAVQGAWPAMGVVSSEGGGLLKYNSLLHTARTILAEEGVTGFWRGNGANIVRASVVYIMKFGTNDMLKEHMAQRRLQKYRASQKTSNNNQKKERSKGQDHFIETPSRDKREALLSGIAEPVSLKKDPSIELGLLSLLSAGGIAGFAQKSISYPLDLVSVRIALGVNAGISGGEVGSQKKSYDSILGCIRRIKHNEGYAGFYKGFLPTLATGVPYVMLQMTLFELYKRQFQKSERSAEGGSTAGPGKGVFSVLMTSGLAGSLAGVTAQLIVFPGDTVRKRMMSNGIDGRLKVYRSEQR